MTPAANGKWTITGQVTAFDCPAGSYCSSGVKTICPQGSNCAEGSPSPTTNSPGSVGDETGLTYDKPCPPGYTCPASSTRITNSAGEYSI